jgi:hypothetical protein
MEKQNDTIALLKSKLQQERSAGNEFRWAMMDMSDRITGFAPRLALQVESVIAMHDKLRGDHFAKQGDHNLVTAEPAPVDAKRFAHNLASTIREIDSEIADNEMSSAEITAEAQANHVQ